MPGFDDRNIIGLVQSTYEERLGGSWAGRMSLYNPDSDSAVEEYGIFGGHAAMREWIGARQANTINKKQYEIRNRDYEATLVVPEKDLNRDKSGLLQAHVNNFVDSTVIYQWEDLLTALINANGACYDGQNFFSATHSWGDSGVQKNLVVAGDLAALNVGTATDPTPQEMAGAILALVGHMMTFKNDKGRYVNGNAKQFVVQVATVPLYSAAMQAITSNLLTGMVDNPINGMKLGGFKFDVLLNAGLTSATDKIRIFREDGALKPFITQEEQGIDYQLLGRGSDFYFDNKAIKLGVDTSRGAGYGQWTDAIDGQLS